MSSTLVAVATGLVGTMLGAACSSDERPEGAAEVAAEKGRGTDAPDDGGRGLAESLEAGDMPLTGANRRPPVELPPDLLYAVLNLSDGGFLLDLTDVALPDALGLADSGSTPVDAAAGGVGGAARPAFPPDGGAEPLGDGGLDAEPSQTPCEAHCQAAGGECVAERCEFECLGPGDCPAAILCPDGFDCVVECHGGSCLDVVRCPEGGDCEVSCGDAACTGGIRCAEKARCLVACDGEASCTGGILGTGGIAQTVRCTGEASCSDKVSLAGEVVELTCSGEDSCDDIVVCNSGVCRLDCIGEDACGGAVEVNANMGRIECGPGACSDVVCRGSSCDVRCEGPQSCLGRVHCETNNALNACR